MLADPWARGLHILTDVGADRPHAPEEREAPRDFAFALLGPREITQEGFRAGKVVETALEKLREVATGLAARGYRMSLTGPWPAYNFLGDGR